MNPPNFYISKSKAKNKSKYTTKPISKITKFNIF